MPLEINEIDIAMRVTEGDSRPGSPHESRVAPAGAIDREDLIEECVRRVLRELRSQDEP
jgi:hypothetical protein